jgi:5'-AMP-activated protein kinase regulatory beta subunit
VKAMKQRAKRIEFKVFAPWAEKVYLCGSFNNWSESSDPMKKDSTGTWKKIKMLSEGIHEYKYLVDGDWTLDPECRTTPNEFGTENNVVYL